MDEINSSFSFHMTCGFYSFFSLPQKRTNSEIRKPSSIKSKGQRQNRLRKVQVMQKCEPSNESEIRCSRSKHLVLGMPHPSHIPCTLIGKSKNTQASCQKDQSSLMFQMTCSGQQGHDDDHKISGHQFNYCHGNLKSTCQIFCTIHCFNIQIVCCEPSLVYMPGLFQVNLVISCRKIIAPSSLKLYSIPLLNSVIHWLSPKYIFIEINVDHLARRALILSRKVQLRNLITK